MRIDAISTGHNPPDDLHVIIEVPIGGISKARQVILVSIALAKTKGD
jgi:hypothetical protein